MCLRKYCLSLLKNRKSQIGVWRKNPVPSPFEIQHPAELTSGPPAIDVGWMGGLP